VKACITSGGCTVAAGVAKQADAILISGADVDWCITYSSLRHAGLPWNLALLKRIRPWLKII